MRINYWHLGPRGRAAVYCFSPLCAGYVIPNKSLKDTLCALFNTLQMGKNKPRAKEKACGNNKDSFVSCFHIFARERAWPRM